jgi:hypothetical protein
MYIENELCRGDLWSSAVHRDGKTDGQRPPLHKNPITKLLVVIDF